MIVEVPRRWRWAIGAVAALSLIELLVLWGAGSSPVEEAPAARAVIATSMPSSLEGNAAEQIDPVAGPTSTTPAGEEIEVCGGGWSRESSGAVNDVRTWLHRDDVQRARTRLIERMRSAGGDFGRVAASWLALRGLDAPAPGEPAFDASREAVAKAATTTFDPKVYAFAFALCRLADTASPPSGGACQLIDARQWARLDPSNAYPWMYVLSNADREDRATRDEALFRIASAQRSETYFMDLPGAIAGIVANASSPDPSTTAATMAMATDAMGIADLFTYPSYRSYRAVEAACRGPELKDANRRQNCEAVATLMSERSDTIMERFMGAQISVTLGAPPSLMDEVFGAHYAFADNYNFAMLNSEGAPLDCGSMRRNLRRLAHFTAVGEAQAAREWIAQSGRSLAAYGQEFRAQQEQSRVAALRRGAAASSAVASRTE